MRPTRRPSSRPRASSSRTPTPSSTVGPSGTSSPASSAGPCWAPTTLPIPSAADRAIAATAPARDGLRTVMTFSSGGCERRPRGSPVHARRRGRRPARTCCPRRPLASLLDAPAHLATTVARHTRLRQGITSSTLGATEVSLPGVRHGVVCDVYRIGHGDGPCAGSLGVDRTSGGVMSCRGRVRAGAAVAIAALLAACGEPASDDSADATSAGIASVTFRLWDPAAADAYRESFDAFNAIHRDIHVDVEIVPEDSYAARAASDLADGVMADVFWTTSDAVAAHAHAGDLVELGEVLGEDRPAWEPSVTSLYTRDDALWAVPQVWDSTVLFYNTELVEQAGGEPAAPTWDPAVVHAPPPAPDDDGEAEAAGPAETGRAPWRAR